MSPGIFLAHTQISKAIPEWATDASVGKVFLIALVKVHLNPVSNARIARQRYRMRCIASNRQEHCKAYPGQPGVVWKA